jgi:Ni/Co efflux regulator RcnB
MKKLVTAIVAASFLLVGTAGVQAQDNPQQSPATNTQTPKKCHKHHGKHHKKNQTPPATEQNNKQ